MADLETTRVDGMPTPSESRRVRSDEADGSEVGRALVELRGDDDGAQAQWEKQDVKARLFGEEPTQHVIGRYLVTKRLGAGGMGEVFAAHDPALDRPVAIKLLHADLRGDTEEHRARMIREAQTLAKLSHPNVVQIYEVGEAEGRVFLAMELVPGSTLKHWQERERPSWRQVLAHYLEAGRGLAAVHRAGLVHRDFKPDNVLLGEDGRVCVADFGLARHATRPPMPSSSEPSAEVDATLGSDARVGASQGGATPTRLTRTGRIAGTPAYMSPEQLRAGEIDARADQFGFCVALYEGLYGQRPFDGRTMAALIVLHHAGATAPPRRSPVPRRLWRVLARGLALRPIDRFESMEALLHALDPVRARRRLAAAGALLAIPVVSLSLVYLDAPDPCPPPTAEALGWGADARLRIDAALEGSGLAYARAASETVVTRLDRLVEQLADERVQACRATHVEHIQSAELLDRRMACLQRTSDHVHGLVDAVGEATPEALDRLVDAVEGVPRPDACGAEQVAGGVEPPDSPAQAARLVELRTTIAQARAWHDLGLDEQAKLQLAAAEPELLAIDYPPLTAELRLVEGLIARSLGDPTAAAALMLEGVELAEGSRHDIAAAELWNELTLLGHEELSIKETTAWLPRARAAVQRIGSPPVLVTTIAHHEGRLALRSGELDRAEARLSSALEQRRAQDLPLEAARITVDLVEIRKLRDDPNGAIELLDEVEAIYVEHLGDRHPRVANAEYNIATMLIALGRWEQARERLNAAIERWTERYGSSHLRLALAHEALHQVELSSGSLDTAMDHARAALRIRQALLPAEHPDVAYSQMVVGNALMVHGDHEAAVQAYTRAWKGLRTGSGDQDLMANLAWANLAEAELAAGRIEAARVHAEAALEVLEAKIPDHPTIALPLKVLGRVALATGSPREALESLQRARAQLERASTVDPLTYGDVLLALSEAFEAAGEPIRADELARAAAEVYAASPGEAAQHGYGRALARRRSLVISNEHDEQPTSEEADDDE